MPVTLVVRFLQMKTSCKLRLGPITRKDMQFSHSEVYFTVKDLWSPMGVLQRGQKVKLM